MLSNIDLVRCFEDVYKLNMTDHDRAHLVVFSQYKIAVVTLVGCILWVNWDKDFYIYRIIAICDSHMDKLTKLQLKPNLNSDS